MDRFGQAMTADHVTGFDLLFVALIVAVFAALAVTMPKEGA